MMKFFYKFVKLSKSQKSLFETPICHFWNLISMYVILKCGVSYICKTPYLCLHSGLRTKASKWGVTRKDSYQCCPSVDCQLKQKLKISFSNSRLLYKDNLPTDRYGLEIYNISQVQHQTGFLTLRVSYLLCKMLHIKLL